MVSTDLIIIGAGPGGYRAAAYAAKNGLRVVIFEQGHVGGTCLNVGCIPTKTYVHSATFDEAVARQPQVVAQLRQGVETLLSHPNITLVRSRAAFLDAHTVACLPSPDSSLPSPDSCLLSPDSCLLSPDSCLPSPDSTAFTAPNIIIATGSSPKLLPLPDIDDPRLVDSTGLLALNRLPARLAIIGAGVIGMEFASIFQRFGSEVTVVEYLKECLPMLDSDIAKRLRKLLERPRVGEQGSGMRRGITFKMKTAVQQLSDLDADVILMATGRRANTDGLNLPAAGITLDAHGNIPVNEHFQISNLSNNHSTLNTPHSTLYAIGDVNGRQMLAHAAEMQGIHVVNHILGRTDGIRFDIMPAAIFTSPEAACVGKSEDQLKAEGTAYTCRKAFHRANGKALAMNETDGMLKLLSDADDRIIGCHAFGAHAADMVQEVSALMCRDTTVSQLRDMVHIHPTLSEIVLSAAEA